MTWKGSRGWPTSAILRDGADLELVAADELRGEVAVEGDPVFRLDGEAPLPFRISSAGLSCCVILMGQQVVGHGCADEVGVLCGDGIRGERLQELLHRLAGVGLVVVAGGA